MPRSRDILQRFRPAGTPGAAANVGVPADRVAELGAELAPVFGALEETQQQAVMIRSEAVAEAQRRREVALERAAAVVSTARREEAAERGEASVRTSSRAAEETAAAMAAAERDVAALRARAAAQMPTYVGRVINATRAALHGTDGPRP
jgi:hypothetical protein